MTPPYDVFAGHLIQYVVGAYYVRTIPAHPVYIMKIKRVYALQEPSTLTPIDLM